MSAKNDTTQEGGRDAPAEIVDEQLDAVQGGLDFNRTKLRSSTNVADGKRLAGLRDGVRLPGARDLGIRADKVKEIRK